MKTDPNNTLPTGDGAAGSLEKRPVKPLRRAAEVGLAIINPFSDLVVIYRKGVQPTFDRLQLLREMLTRTPAAGEALSWEQAVTRAGKSVEQLQTAFKRIRAAWWFLMAVPGALSMILLVMVLATKFNLPSGTLLRAVTTFLVLAALGGIGFVKVLVTTYRLWQLEERRVSEEERGTFKDFLSETHWCRQVLSLGMVR